MKRYLLLLAAGLLAALLLAPRARAPRHATRGSEAAAIPEAALRLVIERGTLAPGSGVVPKDHRVRLAIENRDTDSALVTLAGYQDLLPPRRIAPGETWSTDFLSSRPGDDFAWLIDGRPAGRLNVTGSHLAEGHR